MRPMWRLEQGRTPAEFKEWQAIMDRLRNLPGKRNGELPVIPIDAGAAEVGGIQKG